MSARGVGSCCLLPSIIKCHDGQLKLKSHKMTDNCNWKQLKCFEQISEKETGILLSRFNLLASNNEPNSH